MIIAVKGSAKTIRVKGLSVILLLLKGYNTEEGKKGKSAIIMREG